MTDRTLHVCENCQTLCLRVEDNACEGDGFYPDELPGEDIACPCCGGVVKEET